MWISPTLAANGECVKAAMSQKLVNLRYKYGTLGFDASRTHQEVSSICSDNVAGCFIHRSLGGGVWSIEDRSFDIGRQKCVAPVITISYDFSGANVYISRENNPCDMRAVLRHELQHFAIWKTTREWFLKDLKMSLLQTAAKRAKVCPQNGRCSTGSLRALSAAVNTVEKRWNNMENKNQELLDRVDHSAEQRVNYPVCAPYSLKVGLF